MVEIFSEILSALSSWEQLKCMKSLAKVAAGLSLMALRA